jgi:hypothetical protein
MKMGRSNRLHFGHGARVRWTPMGVLVNFDLEPTVFGHPWQTELASERSVRISPGTINNVDAKIEGVQLSGGDAGQAPPVLKWTRPLLDEEGRGFICAEITVDPTKGFEIQSVEMVQVADPETDDGKPAKEAPNRQGGARPLSGFRARHPVAMLRTRGDGRLEVFQVAHFNLQHRVQQREGTTHILRHFFW